MSDFFYSFPNAYQYAFPFSGPYPRNNLVMGEQIFPKLLKLEFQVLIIPLPLLHYPETLKWQHDKW